MTGSIFPKDEILCALERLLANVESIESFNSVYGFSIENEGQAYDLYHDLLEEYKQWQREKAEEVATTKDCPFCCSSIPINAKKCPHCTSELA